MRAGAVTALAALALAAALGGSCKTYKNQGEVLPPGYEAGVYTPPPNRQVYDDGGAIKGGGGGLGGMGVLNNDGGNPATADASSSGGDMGPIVVIDAGGSDGVATCDLLMQGCGPQMGCYPSAAGVGRCSPTDPGFSEGIQCFDASNCAAGLTCAANLCTPLCSTAQPACAGGKRCVALPASEGVGYCLP
jgi:hypothetical protein